MNAFKNLSIKNKLIGIILMVTSVVVVTGSTVDIIRTRATLRRELANTTTLHAKLIGEYCVVPLSFDDETQAVNILAKLQALPSIVSGYVYDDNGDLFAAFERTGKAIVHDLPDIREQAVFEGGYLHTYQPIVYNGQEYGTVYLRTSTSVLDQKIGTSALITIIIIIVLMGVSYLLSLRLQGLISEPIIDLAGVTEKVSNEGEYSLPIPKHGDDEIGSLYDGFNSMLGQIQARTKALRESEERFRLALKGGDLGFWDYYPDTGNAFFDEKWLDMLGYEKGDIEENVDGWSSLIHPDDGPGIMEKMQAHFDDQSVLFEVEMRLRTKSSDYRWILGKGEVLARDENGNPLRMCGTHLDITDRKNAEEELRESEGYLSRAQEIAHMGHWKVSLETKAVVGSEELYRIFGLDREGSSLETFVGAAHPDDREYYLYHIRRGMEEGIPWDIEYRLLLKDGSEKAVHAIGEAVRDEVGEIIELVGTVQDITERKQAEEDRANLESQLRQAQKMEAIGTLAGGIAHDFNNILMPIMIHTELIQQQVPDDSPLQMNLKEMFTGVMRARDLTGQILTFSRQEEEAKIPLKIGPIIKEVLKLLRASVPTTIEIRQNIGTETGAVNADPTQIHQVLMNLCTNAYHAMREQGGILEVSLSEADIGSEEATELPDLKTGSYTKLTVSDTGHGMSRMIMERIFDPYYTTKAKGEGTGMGLSVVHGIVKGHDGAIAVDSEPGKGTTFDIFLPMVESRVGMETSVTEPIRGRSERVLFIDDEQSMVNALVPMMENLGYRVTATTDSIEALEIFKRGIGLFDLVITDHTMPHMTGAELAGEILKIRPGMPIVLCTGFSDQINEEKAMAMGIKAFVKKPVIMKEMADTMRKALGDYEIHGE